MALGLAMGRSRAADSWLNPALIIGLNGATGGNRAQLYLDRAERDGGDTCGRAEQDPGRHGDDPRKHPRAAPRSGRDGARVPHDADGAAAPCRAAPACATDRRRRPDRDFPDLENRAGRRISWPLERGWGSRFTCCFPASMSRGCWPGRWPLSVSCWPSTCSSCGPGNAAPIAGGRDAAVWRPSHLPVTRCWGRCRSALRAAKGGRCWGRRASSKSRAFAHSFRAGHGFSGPDRRR